LKKYDFSLLSQDNTIKQIPLDCLVPYAKHPFKMYEGERKSDMIESIKQNGVMTPIVVRPHKDQSGKYEILIGHNRWNCSKEAGLTDIQAVVKENLSDEEAENYVILSNTFQRGFTELAVSEQAKVVSVAYEQQFSQGKRNDILNEIRKLSGESIEEQPINSREAVGSEYGLSKNTVARLIRINKLNQTIKELIDKKLISIRAGVELSYISSEGQELIYHFIFDVDTPDKLIYKVSEVQAKELRSLFANENTLSFTMVETVLNKEKKPATKKVSLTSDIYSKYFSKKTAEETQKIIELALQHYFNY
jgi:ParB family chromosome partitioning protein